ncbi:hypothetical protein ELH05_24930 [Rhizobium ruizarguesonis]|uniref:hypothetical protein n=1 Tax=Rhizobium ruizarguesonis TaxID=2081791 RepID=UPI0010310CC9|nr:hypothetical protein [Rhizobium ruizarguesonis]TBE30850.1 hypothetical protein ELH05_24930 [Rhizobium ruizarguesonis]
MESFGRAAVCGVVFLCLFLSGCANKGYVEYQAYNSSFDLQYQQADRVLSSLAIAERKVYKKSNPNNFIVFDPNKAGYYLDTIEPPITSSLRKSLLAVKAYNAVLMSLANGEAADAYTAKVGGAITDTAAAIAAAAITVQGPDDAKAAEKFMNQVGGNLAKAMPGLKAASRLRGQQAFRTLLDQTHGRMDDALNTLIQGTPDFYRLFVAARAKTEGGAKTDASFTPDDLAVLEREQTEMAGWVLMLKAARAALSAAADAVASRTDVTDITALAGTASDVRVLAEQLKAARLSQGGKQ